MKINTSAIEAKYKDIDLEITAIEEIMIEKMNYNLIKFVYSVEYLPRGWMGDEIFGVKEKFYLEDEVVVRVDKNLVYGLMNQINSIAKQYNL